MNSRATIFATGVGLLGLALIATVALTKGNKQDVPPLTAMGDKVIISADMDNKVKVPDIQADTNNIVKLPDVQGNILRQTSSPVQVKNKTLVDLKADAKRIVYVLGEINYATMTNAIKKLQQLDKTSGVIYVLISSPGGSVFAGESFITAMQSANNPVHTICMDFCASMGAIIHQHGQQRYAYDRSILMFHDASGGAQGKVGEMMAMLNFIFRKLEKTNKFIALKSGMSYEKWSAMMAHDLWIDSEDAQREGLVDAIARVVPLGDAAFDELLSGNKRLGTKGELGVLKVLPLTFGLENEPIPTTK